MPYSHMACFSFGAGATITFGTTTDVVCTHVAASGATAPTIVGDYYGNSAGTMTADAVQNDWANYAGTATGRPGTVIAHGAGLVYTIERLFASDTNNKDYVIATAT
jgi:hypothetical protein